MTAVSTPALENLPAHCIRRLQQISVALFLEATKAQGVTPVQYAALSAIQREPGLDQKHLASRIGFDTSTLGSVIDRLESHGWVIRHTSERDRRLRLLFITDAGVALLRDVVPDVCAAQERMLAPLTAPEQAQFMALLRKLVEANNALSRAPSVQPA